MSSSNNNTIYKKTSFLAGNNSEFINEFYADYISDPNSLPESWRKFFEGLSDNEKLALAYSAADVIVVPSLEETFSNTTAEAIACGTPVVGFKTGAIPDLAIDGITGFSIEIGDVNALAQALMRALETKFDVKEIRNFATERLDFPLQAKKYEQLFHRLKQS